MFLSAERTRDAPADIFIAGRDNKLHLREKDDVVANDCDNINGNTRDYAPCNDARIGFSPEIKSSAIARSLPSHWYVTSNRPIVISRGILV